MQSTCAIVSCGNKFPQKLFYSILLVLVYQKKKREFCHNLLTHMLFQTNYFLSYTKHKMTYFGERWGPNNIYIPLTFIIWTTTLRRFKYKNTVILQMHPQRTFQ